MADDGAGPPSGGLQGRTPQGFGPHRSTSSDRGLASPPRPSRPGVPRRPARQPGLRGSSAPRLAQLARSLAIVAASRRAMVSRGQRRRPSSGLDLQGGTTVTLNPQLLASSARGRSHRRARPGGRHHPPARQRPRRRRGRRVRASNRIEITVPGKGRQRGRGPHRPDRAAVFPRGGCTFAPRPRRARVRVWRRHHGTARPRRRGDGADRAAPSHRRAQRLVRRTSPSPARPPRPRRPPACEVARSAGSLVPRPLQPPGSRSARPRAPMPPRSIAERARRPRRLRPPRPRRPGGGPPASTARCRRCTTPPARVDRTAPAVRRPTCSA